ncbi:MAG TPA: beta-galactosidase, partial [Chloroflexota bacterium]|nr:beta-galactosidase [Chloroflexota bacterium]
MYRWLAAVAWLAALIAATLGLAAGRTVFDRGVAYGPDLPVLPDVSLSRRAVNTQLELEPDRESVRRSLRMIKAAGFGWIRQQFAWEGIETSSKGRYDWTRSDALIDAATESGIDVLARLDLPPEWARPPGSYKTHPPRDVRDFGDFVAAFTQRYAGRVRYVQLWNEPNLNEEWGRGGVDPGGYVELLRAGYEGAKRGNPIVRVLSGALAQTLEPDDPSASGLDDLLYLERMYLAGAAPYFDVLAANAYGLTTGPDDRRASAEQANFPRLLLVRDVMLRHGDGAKSVWVAEFGWNALPADWTGEPSPWGQVPPERQAAYIVSAYERAASEWPWLGPMALWLFRRPHAAARDPTPFFALVDGDWNPRPAYDTLVRSADRQPLSVGAHQESSPLLTYEGLWQWSPNAAAQLGELRETPISGAALRWRFRGTRVDLVAPVGPTRGTAYVKINGAYTLANRLPLNPNGQAVADFYAPRESSQARVALASGLPDRVHEVELIVTGDPNPASAGAGVGIDAIVVSRARPVVPLIALGGVWGVSGLAVAWLLLRRRLRALPIVAKVLDLRVLRVAVLATAAALPFAPLSVRTSAGTYSPVELLALLCISVWLARVLLGIEREA